MTDAAAGSPAPQGSPTATGPATTTATGTPAAPTPGTPDPGTQALQGQAAPATPAAPAVTEYQPFQAPEGITLDGPVLSEFTALAKASGLTQESAQQLINLIPNLQGQFTAAATNALNQQHEQQVTAWKQEATADPNIGAQGLAAAQTAIGRFLTPDAKAVLEASGLANHPALVRSFMAIGAAISEDVHVGSGAPQPPAKTATEVRYTHPDSQALLKHG